MDIQLHFVFIHLCAVTKQAEGKKHGFHMPEGALLYKPPDSGWQMDPIGEWS